MFLQTESFFAEIELENLLDTRAPGYKLVWQILVYATACLLLFVNSGNRVERML